MQCWCGAFQVCARLLHPAGIDMSMYVCKNMSACTFSIMYVDGISGAQSYLAYHAWPHYLETILIANFYVFFFILEIKKKKERERKKWPKKMKQERKDSWKGSHHHFNLIANLKKKKKIQTPNPTTKKNSKKTIDIISWKCSRSVWQRASWGLQCSQCCFN